VAGATDSAAAVEEARPAQSRHNRDGGLARGAPDRGCGFSIQQPSVVSTRPYV